ncbi:MAG: hypothetical protein GF368_04880 [Candidatus Aenigmarchaeota archaeon]|nr:hypothetical protein [Candidatus Aenigmarchaeota archaeon]
MKILRSLIGILLITFAWVDPFELGLEFQILLFILGFDLMELLVKIGVFVADLYFDISGLGIYLVALIGIEALVYALKLKKLVGYIVKPLAVFGIVYLNGLGWQLGLIVGGIDLLLNFSKKYI